MSPIDILVVLLGLLLSGLGALQLATGRILVGWRPGRRHLPPAFFRAYGAAYAFFGLLLVWGILQRPLGATFQAVAGALFSMGFVVSASWAFVLAVRNRPVQ